MNETQDDYPTVFYGLCFLVTIVLAPVWVPFYLLGILAKKLGIKP
jgi:hypothetical protein